MQANRTFLPVLVATALILGMQTPSAFALPKPIPVRLSPIIVPRPATVPSPQATYSQTRLLNAVPAAQDATLVPAPAYGPRKGIEPVYCQPITSCR